MKPHPRSAFPLRFAATAGVIGLAGTGLLVGVANAKGHESRSDGGSQSQPPSIPGNAKGHAKEPPAGATPIHARHGQGARHGVSPGAAALHPAHLARLQRPAGRIGAGRGGGAVAQAAAVGGGRSSARPAPSRGAAAPAPSPAWHETLRARAAATRRARAKAAAIHRARATARRRARAAARRASRRAAARRASRAPAARRGSRTSAAGRAAGAGSQLVGAGVSLAVPGPLGAPAATPATSPPRGDATAQRRATERRRGAPPKPSAPKRRAPRTGLSRTIHDAPGALGVLLAAVGALAVVLLGGALLTVLRARRLARQRAALARDVGALQAALLPPVPARLRGLKASAAYRPAEGPAAGGDFYDLFTLPGGRVCAMVGDISGHGREALAGTAFLRYTLRAHVEAGVGLRDALRLTGEALERTAEGRFATVLLAVHDTRAGTLTYASAGHPPPIIAGGAEHGPVVAASSPPIGLGIPTGLRQTTISLPAGAVACLYTDGLPEARTKGRLLGDDRLAELVRELAPDAAAEDLVERVAAEADRVPDDLAVCLVRATTGASTRLHVEELEVEPGDPEPAARFLRACGIGRADTAEALARVRAVLAGGGPAILRVGLDRPGPPRVEVVGGAAGTAATSA
jgi:Stage II sporulation protein E (SpoIIE)